MKTRNSSFSLLIVTAFLLGCLAFSPKLSAQNQSATMKSGYANVNDVKMYYEIHGTGIPLVLLHGSFMTIDLNFGQLIPELAKNRQVIAVELQGHGRTADVERPFSYEAMAKDVIELLNQLNIDSADVFGYSMGGGVALQMAIHRPDKVRKLVIVSATFRYDGWLPEALAMFPNIKGEMFEGTPLKTEYERLAPDPKHWNAFVPKLMNVRLEHAAAMFKLFGGGVFGDIAGLPKSQLAVLPATTHVSVMMQTEWLVANVPAFLDGTGNAPAGH
jgi:pimeloyl-ACP methyl ester carboxylesterase